jgi:glyoxylase-like metal-dependent hydrolase (beta-lactamase superfamily II)
MSSKAFLIDAFKPQYGRVVQISPGIARVTARNPGPLTRWGTNTYLVGQNELAVIDPGPDSDDHARALRRAIGNRRVTHLCVSHEHPDHSPLAFRMAAFFDAPLIMRECLPRGGEPTRAWRPGAAEIDPASAGGVIDGGDWTIRVVPTPGHTKGHLSFALMRDNVLFSGDHVMAWATPAIRPPEGDMCAYLESLDETIQARYARLLPGHGPPVENPDGFLRACRDHRLARERQVLAAIAEGPLAVSDIVARLYVGLSPGLVDAAAGTVCAHLVRLRRLGRTAEEDGRWRACTANAHAHGDAMTAPGAATAQSA